MKVGIIGAGFTGLAAGYTLAKEGHAITIFEKDSLPGGLAVGYQEKGWDWTLEKHYHHWFTNDASVLSLAKEINHPVVIRRPKTSVFVDNDIYQLDSPTQLLKFPLLSPLQRFRMAATLGLLRYNPFWKPLERYHAETVLQKAMGKKAYRMLWQPQFQNKFGEHTETISLAWFWARISKRTSSLAYPEGGFLDFAQHLVKEIEKKGGTIHFSTEIEKLEDSDHPTITAEIKGKKQTMEFDRIIVTLPTFLFLKLSPQLPDSYQKKMKRLSGLGATNLVLRLREPFFKDNTYWLSVCDTAAPVMAIVEHTNFMDKNHYDNEHLLYLGNYVPTTHPYFQMTEKEMLKTFDPFLKKINPEYDKSLIGMQLFKAPFAQPIIPINYSQYIPEMKTPLPHVFLANIEQVYPWDRGTNYAVELGEKVANLIQES